MLYRSLILERDATGESMKLSIRSVATLASMILLMASAACGPQSQTQGNSNASQAPTIKTPTQAQSVNGTIEVTSTPPGARVLLILVDESGATEPQPRGVTPTTITVSPGKYTVDVAFPGYKFFQKTVEVKENGTSKVNAVLRKG
jgi:PEGA domain-containing protein